MKELSVEELKSRALEGLLYIDEFCKANSIRYSLAYGTLLGAVRHKGFIPWDDDIDVMMPREDYERFINTFEHPDFAIITHKNNKDYLIPFAKVYDKHSIIDELSQMKPCFGAYVDVFPIDEYPDSEIENKRFLKNKKLLNIAHNLKIISFSKERKWSKNIALAVGKLLFIPVSLSYLTRKIEKLSIRYKNSQSSYAGIFAPTDSNPKWRMNKRIFEEFSTIEFEGHFVSCIKDTDTYLHNIYGDYMKLPPVDKRVSHHPYKGFIFD